MENTLNLTDTQYVVLQVLNSIDAVACGVTIAFALHNVIRYLVRAKIRHFYIVTFYVLALFCLTAWAITAMAQADEPASRYFVLQLMDHPEYWHITGNVAIIVFYVLFALVSTTIFHIDQALTLVLPHKEDHEARLARVRRNMRCYNVSIISLCLVYFAFLIYVFFVPHDVGVRLVLGIDLFFRLLLFITYAWAVARLYRRLHHFPDKAMQAEVTSIKRQFLSFLIGYLIEEIFQSALLAVTEATFATAVVKTIVVLMSMVQPVALMLFAHHHTFKGIETEGSVLRPSQQTFSGQGLEGFHCEIEKPGGGGGVRTVR